MVKGKGKHKLTKKIMIAIFIFLLALLTVTSIHLLSEGGIIKHTPKVQDRNFSIEDRCSLIVGKVVHPIDREDECINKCIAQCETYSLEYHLAKFEARTASCNLCDCFCK